MCQNHRILFSTRFCNFIQKKNPVYKWIHTIKVLRFWLLIITHPIIELLGISGTFNQNSSREFQSFSFSGAVFKQLTTQSGEWFRLRALPVAGLHPFN